MGSRFKYIVGIVGIILLVFGVWYFRNIVAYILISAAISIVGQPIVRFISEIKVRNYALPRGVSAGITLAFLWLIIIVFFRVFIPLILLEANELSSINVNDLYFRFSEPLDDLLGYLQKTGVVKSEESFQAHLTARLMSILNVSYFSDFFAGVTSVLGNLFIAFFSISFITYFFLKETSLFTEGVLLFVPDDHVTEVRRIMKSIRRLLTRYLGGIIIEVIMVMFLITLGLWIVGLGFQHALICGLFSGVMNVIPYIGPWIGAAFSIIIGIAVNIDLPFQSELLPFIGLMVLVFASVQTIDNVLFQPLIYSSSVNAHPLEIFIVIMMAASVAGIGGMVLAIPFYTVVRVIAKEFFSGFKVVKRLTRNI